MSETTETERALASVQVGWAHLHQQRPLAAWANWQRALRIDPGLASAQAALDRLLLSPELPLVARTEYHFLSPTQPAQRERWATVLAQGDLSELDQAEQAFRSLADADPRDLEARMNQALCLAWLGRNVDAIAAFLAAADSSNLDPKQYDQGVQACTLVELLRQGGGAEQLADEFTNILVLEWTRPHRDLIRLLEQLGPVRSVAPTPTQVPGLPSAEEWFTGEWLDRPMPTAAATLEIVALPRLRASLIVGQGAARFSLPSSDPGEMTRLERVLEAILADLFVVLDRQARPRPIALMDADIWRFRVPSDLDPETRARLFRDWVEQYYENVWIRTPKRALGHADQPALAPLAAAAIPSESNPSLRKRLEGLIAFREQLSLRPSMSHLYQGYPFDRLRRRLGLPLIDPSLIEENDLSCIGLAELDALDLATLSPAQLAQIASGPFSRTHKERLAVHLFEVAPRLLLEMDFPFLALQMLDLIDDPEEVLEALRAVAGTDIEASAKIDFLDQLDYLLHLATEHQAEADFPRLESMLEALDPQVLPPACAILEKAGVHQAARQLEDQGLRQAIEMARPWPVIDRRLSPLDIR